MICILLFLYTASGTSNVVASDVDDEVCLLSLRSSSARSSQEPAAEPAAQTVETSEAAPSVSDTPPAVNEKPAELPKIEEPAPAEGTTTSDTNPEREAPLVINQDPLPASEEPVVSTPPAAEGSDAAIETKLLPSAKIASSPWESQGPGVKPAEVPRVKFGTVPPPSQSLRPVAQSGFPKDNPKTAVKNPVADALARAKFGSNATGPAAGDVITAMRNLGVMIKQMPDDQNGLYFRSVAPGVEVVSNTPYESRPLERFGAGIEMESTVQVA